MQQHQWSYCFIPRSVKRSRCQQGEARELNRVEQKQNLEEVEFAAEGPADCSQSLVMRQAESSEKTAIVKLLCNAILVLGKGCNTSLMSATPQCTLCLSSFMPRAILAYTVISRKYTHVCCILSGIFLRVVVFLSKICPPHTVSLALFCLLM